MSKFCDIKPYINKLNLTADQKVQLNNTHNNVFIELRSSKSFQHKDGKLYALKNDYNKSINEVAALNIRYGNKLAALINDEVGGTRLVSINVLSTLPNDVKNKLVNEIESNNNVQFQKNQSVSEEGILASEIKEGVKDLFKENEELKSIGTEQQYSDYLNTIFPESKVKEIVYRGGNITKEEFEYDFEYSPTDGMDLGNGLYFSASKKIAREYGNPRAALINIKNPNDANKVALLRTKQFQEGLPITWTFDENGKYDGIVDLSQDFKNTYEAVVFDSINVYILGSKEDVKGFKDFVENNTTFESLPPEMFNFNKKCI